MNKPVDGIAISIHVPLMFWIESARAGFGEGGAMIDLSLDDEASGAALFENTEWRVGADGLEHRRTGYFIARDAIAMRREADLWAWPLHLGEKAWCAPRPFREAFLAALDLFDVARDGLLTRSFAIGFAGGRAVSREGFVALGDLARPRPIARRRPVAAESRSPSRDAGAGMARAAEA